MSAKGSALGAGALEGGVELSHAPLPRAGGNGTKRSRPSSESSTGTTFQEAGITDTPETSHPALSSSVRTLILGIDYDGRIVQHDRNADRILARKPEDLLGAQLIELTSGPHGNHVAEDQAQAQGNSHAARPADAAAAVAGLLEAIRSDREGSAMLTIDTRDGIPAEAVVTVYPMRAGGTSLAALALLRIPAPNSERFVDPALMRRQMLDDALTRIGDTLDIDDVARVLLAAIVPHFCNVAGLLLLESLAGDDELPSHGPEGSLPLRRIALLHDMKDPAWEATFPTGEILRYPQNTPYFRCMDTGAPVLEATITKSQASEIAKSWRRKPVAKPLSGASMGRLRTAVQTLAMLELPPADSLLQLDELMHTLGEREPHFATCAYAVYDAVSGECEVAVAGHLPPLLVHPDGSNELLDVPPAPPLGIGDGEVESRRFKVEDGSLFVLYTDGLVENKGQDISDGLARLRGIFGPGSPTRPLEDLCKATLDGVYSDHQRDDIAMLIARLRRLPEDSYASWTLAPKLTSVREARSVLAEPMKRWELEALSPTTELLVSELVTNAVRYSRGEITLRLVNEKALVCEVLDNSGALPRLRQASSEDENGRGLQVVRQLSQRWGARRTATGKVVWC